VSVILTSINGLKELLHSCFGIRTFFSNASDFTQDARSGVAAWQFGDKARRLTDAKAPFARGEGWHFVSLNFRPVPDPRAAGCT